MKPFHRHLLAAVALAAMSTAGCSEKEPQAEPSPVTVKPATPSPVTVKPAEPAKPAEPGPATVKPAAPGIAAVPAAPAKVEWSTLKDYSFELRQSLLAGLPPLLDKVDEQITALKARRVVMIKETTDTKDWDFAMKEMDNSRSYLRGMATELATTSGPDWDRQKELFGRAWLRSQAAYAAVRASTTN